MRTAPLAIAVLAVLTLLPGCIFRDIRTTREEIAAARTELTAIRSDLAEVRRQLDSLASIEKSLTHIDAHLSSLRGTMENIDEAVPLKDVTEDAAPPTPSDPPVGQGNERRP